ncbi:MAG: type 11 methyltransferase [Parcubacteria group bacterium Gr01-1014_17]|nr:MAG: type 11 methyltransferase [Parcubacteria group bacterium Gr01-1014_17]
MVIKPTGSRQSKIVRSGEAARIFHAFGPKKGRVLDMGCGAFPFQPSGSGYEVVGIDQDKVGFVHCDFSYDQLPFPDESLDAVTAWEVFEHLENPFFAMREVRRVLKSGGRFFMSVPNPAHIESRVHFFLYGDLPRWRRRSDHIFIPLPAIMRKTFAKRFNLISMRYALPSLLGFRLPFCAGKHTGLNAVWMFEK